MDGAQAMDDVERPAEFVEALAKGLAVLESSDAAHPDMALSEVARRVGLEPTDHIDDEGERLWTSAPR